MAENVYLREAQKNVEEIRENRRYFHKNAELGFKEIKTAERIADYLRKLGLEVQTGIAQTGVVGLLQCQEDGKTAALRADIDALPMQEKNEVLYASVNEGVMHACGHDGHTAIQMEAARLLVGHKDQLKGQVKFIFQPCEDMIPSGAEPMIEEGVLENPKPEAIFTMHLMSSYPEGTLWIKPEYISISSADFYVTFFGKGGHVGSPHKVIDPIIMAGMLINTVQTLMLKSTPPGQTTIFAVSSVHGGTATNIIPDDTKLSGSIRTANPEAREKAIEDFKRMIQGIAATAGGKAEVKIEMANPSIYNDPQMVELLKLAGAKVLGKDKINTFNQIRAGGDDAAYFNQKVPGVYWFLGTGNPEKGFDRPHHNPYYDFDDSILPFGAAVQAQAVTDFLLG